MTEWPSPGKMTSARTTMSSSFAVAATVERVFAAFTESARRRAWERAEEPEVLSAIHNRTLRLRWPNGVESSLVLTRRSDGGTKVSVRETLLPAVTLRDARAEWRRRLNALSRSLG